MLSLLAVCELAVGISALHLELGLVVLLLLLLLFGSDVHNLLFDITLLIIFTDVLHFIAVVDWHAFHIFLVLFVFLQGGIIIGDSASSSVDIAVATLFTVHGVTCDNFFVFICRQGIASSICTSATLLCLPTRRALHDDLLDLLVDQVVSAKARDCCGCSSIVDGSCVRICLHF